jgi:hypothetical protein
MFDLNAIITAALAAAVAEVVKPLVVQVDALEAEFDGMERILSDRIQALEGADDATTEAFNRSADRFAGIDAAERVLAERIVALETKLAEAQPVVVDEAKMVEALNSQEWFWEKLRGFTDAMLDRALDSHCAVYDHDDYDRTASAVDDLDLEALSNIESTIDNRIDNRIEEALDEKLDAALDDKIDEKIDEALDEKLDAALDDKIDEKIEDALDDKLEGKIDDALAGSLRDKIKYLLREASISIDL